MNKIDIYLEHLKNTRDLSSLPSNYNFELEKELNQLISRIKSYSTFEQAEKVLWELGLFQTKLATMSFKYNLPLSNRLNILVRLFDRHDDKETRKYFFDFVTLLSGC